MSILTALCIVMALAAVIYAVYEYSEKCATRIVWEESERHVKRLEGEVKRLDMANREMISKYKIIPFHQYGDMVDKLEVYRDTARDSLNTIKELRGIICDFKAKLTLRESLQSIKFLSRVPHKGWVPTEFKLGLGPCTKTVDAIEWVETSDKYILIQHHDDGTRKEFMYDRSDVTGRIEKFYG